MEKVQAPAHILHVDDNLGDYDLLSQALAEFKTKIFMHHVANAVLAFSFLGRQPPFQNVPTVDLILLDVNLPVINGLKALDIIVSATEWANIPVIMLTSSQRQKEKDLAMASGAKEFLTKPGDWNGYHALAGKIIQYLDARQELKKRITEHGDRPSNVTTRKS